MRRRDDGGVTGRAITVERSATPPSTSPPGLAERAIVLFAKAMVALAYVSIAYGVLVASFFLWFGIDTISFVNPGKSPAGPLVTILVIWPVVGFVCLVLDGGLGDLLAAVDKGARRVARYIRRGPTIPT